MQNLSASTHQLMFIDLLKKTVPVNINLAEEMSSILNISSDSAYRRLRCETDLTLDETVKLCNHFDIPLDALSNATPNSITFKIHKLTSNLDSFAGYLDGLNTDITWMTKYEQRELIYAAEDLPVFYSFFFPNLARFKLGYWNKSIQNVTEMQGMMVEDVSLPEAWKEKVHSIVINFLKVNSIEIWNQDTLKSTINQVRFYWEAGFFGSKITAQEVIQDLYNLIELIRKQCDMGKKMNFLKGSFTDADFTMYTSDLMIGNNCVLLHADNKEASYIGYNSFNYMRTSNSYFNEQERNWIQNLIAKSTLISKVAEKQRNQFIKDLRRQVEVLEEFVNNS